MVAIKDAGQVRLVSRNARDHTKRFRDLVAALTGLKPETFTLDGEVAVFDQDISSRASSGSGISKWLKVKQRDYRVEERDWDPRNKS